MGVFKELRGNLPEMHYLCLAALAVDLVVLIIQAVAIVLIRQIVVDVEVFDRFLTSLLGPKDEINPVCDLAGHLVTL